MNASSSEIAIDGRHHKSITSDALGFYEHYWEKGSQPSTHSQQRFKNILDALFPDGLKNRKILEIGVGGEGGMIFHLKKDNTVLGLDASEAARANCRQLGLEILIHNLDKQPLPFNDHDFDVIFAMEIFEHFAAPQIVIEELKRVLKPNGLCIISIPHPLTHHWPRLFYPSLFKQVAFKEFLMINDFEIMTVLRLGQHLYERYFQDESEHYWSRIFLGRKLTDQDSDVYLRNGNHFWNRKDGNGIRLRPMEAIDSFRRSHELNRCAVEPRFMLVRSLVYRLICGEKEEFESHFNWLTEVIKNKETNINLRAKALYHFAMMFLDLQKAGSSTIHQHNFEAAIKMLKQCGALGTDYAKRVEHEWSRSCPQYG